VHVGRCPTQLGEPVAHRRSIGGHAGIDQNESVVDFDRIRTAEVAALPKAPDLSVTDSTWTRDPMASS
jgi:hypothetical protein